jgi:hypothetical protein
MSTISEHFSPDKFRLESIREYRAGERMAVVALRNYEYEISLSNLELALRRFDINLREELYENYYRTETIDDRQLWQKDMDFRMGKSVDFNNKGHLVELYPDKLVRELERISKNKEDYER